MRVLRFIALALLAFAGAAPARSLEPVAPDAGAPTFGQIAFDRGHNVLALAVTSDGAAGNGLEAVRLGTIRNVRGGLPVRMVEAPQ